MVSEFLIYVPLFNKQYSYKFWILFTKVKFHIPDASVQTCYVHNGKDIQLAFERYIEYFSVSLIKMEIVLIF